MQNSQCIIKNLAAGKFCNIHQIRLKKKKTVNYLEILSMAQKMVKNLKDCSKKA